MIPNSRLITIKNNLEQVQTLLDELVLQPRLNALKWALITKQTPNIKIGYPGQHLASLITGMEGERTGARGNDLCDGSEVKSCSRIDQLDECAECKSPVARIEKNCSECASAKIIRKNDSKWLFTIRSQEDLNVLINDVGRVVLVLGDYPNFDDDDFDTLRFQVFEVWPENMRHRRFVELMVNYYQKIYLVHKEKNPEKTPAPKNFWPYSYQFYMCNPIQTFSCTVKNAYSQPIISIEKYIEPSTDRTELSSEDMPAGVLNESELDQIFQNATLGQLSKCLINPSVPITENIWAKLKFKEKINLFSGINESLRECLELRDTDRTSTSKSVYKRRKS